MDPSTIQSVITFLLILNPFALCLYLRGVVEDLDRAHFAAVLGRASLISFLVFTLFVWTGEPFLVGTLGVRPEAMRVFGGIIFFNVAYIYVTKGYKALDLLRGNIDELPSEIAMPFMIGGGTITQAIILGKQHDNWIGTALLAGSMVICALFVFLFKLLHDHLKGADERLLRRYMNLLSRANGLLIGALSIDMIVQGVHELWFFS